MTPIQNIFSETLREKNGISDVINLLDPKLFIFEEDVSGLELESLSVPSSNGTFAKCISLLSEPLTGGETRIAAH